VNDVRGLGGVIAETDAIFIVDAISGLTAEEFYPDKWGVDMVVGGSQKGLMLPPGLSFLSVSKKAEKLIEASTLPKFYFDLKAALKSYDKDDTPWTPAVSLINGLNMILDMLLEEGLDNVLARHARLAKATREAMKAIGLELFSLRPANTLTAVKVPAGIDGAQIPRKLRDEQKMTIAGGQAALKGKIFRVAHLGYMDEFDTISVISALEIVLSQLGYNMEFGKGVAKAQELLSGK
jgi:aspartate aminotransferase-like enzyme